MSDSVDLSSVEETLMIPLWARALSTRTGGMIDDPASVEMVERLDYDFDSKLGHAKSVASYSLVRTARFDEVVREFVSEHPDGVVVELGCGLDTRWERCGGNRVEWFDLDLPDAIALRRRFVDNTVGRRMIAASLLDTSWHELVGSKDRPFLFVAEGVLLYLQSEEVAGAIRSLGDNFPVSSIVLDTISSGVIKRQGSHPLMRNYDAQFQWSVDDIETLVADNHYRVDGATFLADLRPEEMRKLPFSYRLLVMLMRRMRWFRESTRMVQLVSQDP